MRHLWDEEMMGQWETAFRVWEHGTWIQIPGAYVKTPEMATQACYQPSGVEIPEAHWPGSLAAAVSSRFSVRPQNKAESYREGHRHPILASLAHTQRPWFAHYWIYREGISRKFHIIVTECFCCSSDVKWWEELSFTPGVTCPHLSLLIPWVHP